ncbi:MAG: hypothetical protein FD169_2082 [Bacillota bacterium]|nr:MAG: hypothetical protein FD169_2082 [Bacillota bacterium]
MKLSYPLFVNVPEDYCEAEVRILAVGQQTLDWHNNDTLGVEPVNTIMGFYKDFDMGSSYRSTPFWQALGALTGAFAVPGRRSSILWTNLLRVSQCARRPDPLVEEELHGGFVLQSEVKFLKPDVVVFFTGPYYDERLLNTLVDAELTPLTRWVSVVKHDLLPSTSYRSYHPKFLRMRKHWDEVFDSMRAHYLDV